jgi:hypothetical protein
LFLFSRKNENSLGASDPNTTQSQDSIITVETQNDSPLKISSVAATSPFDADSQIMEFGYYLINSSQKPIRAYAIKQELSVDGTKSGGTVSLDNLQLTNSLLRPNESRFTGDTVRLRPNKKTIVVLSVDFVEFSDGTKWGLDSLKSSAQVAGQRAGARSISQQLLKILNDGKIDDVVREMDKASTTTEVPNDQPEEWRIGFRQGRVVILDRLKRSKEKQGISEFERVLRRFGETFKSLN